MAMTEQDQIIMRRALEVAGAILEDCTEGSPAQRVAQAAEWRNLGTDGDLTEADRELLRGYAQQLAALS